MKILAILYCWVGICYPFALNAEPALAELKRILGCFLFCYIIASLATKEKLLPYLYIGFVLLLIGAWMYAKSHILATLDIELERVNDETLNANTLAYYTFYVTISIYILGLIVKNKMISRIFSIALFFLIVICFFTAIYTASRQILIIQIPLIAILLWKRYFKVSFSKIVVLTIALAAIVFMFKDFGLKIYDNSFLKTRIEHNVQEDPRILLVKESFIIGCQNPFFGAGPGNVTTLTSRKQFAHNTFLELFGNTGIIGLVVFSILILGFVSKRYKIYKRSRDELDFAFLIFGCFWLIYQIFYVFYADLILMGFFMLVATHAEMYDNRKINTYGTIRETF